MIREKAAADVTVQTYTYDGFGNMTSMTTVGQGTQTFSIDHATNRLSGPSYDAAGNQLSWGAGGETFHYAYYPTNQIRQITGGSPPVTRLYGYTADGERVGAFASAGLDAGVTYTIRDLEGHVLRRYLESNNVWTWKEDSIWGPNGLLATVSPTEGTKSYTLDHLGTPRLVTNRCGDRIALHNYYPFGEEATYPYQDTERMKFTGQERDLNLTNQTTDDLDYMRARYYSFNIGRFMSVDPVRGKVGSSQSWNAYTYVRDNPINRFDPFGMKDKDRQPCEKNQPCAEGVTAGEPPSAEPKKDDTAQEDELRNAIARTIALSLSAVPAGDAFHEALEAPVKEAVQQRTNAWAGHEGAKDAVTTLGFAGYMARSIREIQISSKLVQEQVAIQAHIAELGGVSEEVATGFLESGITTGGAGILAQGSAMGGMELGRVIRQRVLPQSWNTTIGNALLSGTNFMHVTGLVEWASPVVCPVALCGR